MSHVSVKLAITRKFFPLMKRRHTNQLLELGRDIISTTIAMLTGVIALWADMRKEWSFHLTTSAGHADSLRKRGLLSNSFVSARLSLGEVFGTSLLVSLKELSSIITNIKDIASFIKLSGWFSSIGARIQCFIGSPRAEQLLLLWLFWQNLVSTWAASHLWHHNAPLCVLKWALWYLRYHPDLN